MTQSIFKNVSEFQSKACVFNEYTGKHHIKECDVKRLLQETIEMEEGSRKPQFVANVTKHDQIVGSVTIVRNELVFNI